jgi:hypothetical protein
VGVTPAEREPARLDVHDRGQRKPCFRAGAYAQFKDWLYHDAFHYVFHRVQGNGSIEAQLLAPKPSESSTGADTSAGLMVRESSYVIGQTEGSLTGKQLSEGDVFLRMRGIPTSA